jgi:hypothetical protein
MMPDIPRYLGLVIWEIEFPLTDPNTGLETVVKSGDVVTIPGKGTYYINHDLYPTSLDTSATVAGIQQTYADGISTLPTNQTMSFKMKRERIPDVPTDFGGSVTYPDWTAYWAVHDPGVDHTGDFEIINAPVYVTSQAGQLEPTQGMVSYGFRIVVQANTNYTVADRNGQNIIRTGDTVLWDGLKNGKDTVSRIDRTYQPLDRLQIMIAAAGVAS